MQDKLAPIALFVYNRPEHTRLVIDSLLKNDLSQHTTLYIFADGPKLNATAAEIEKINSTRQLIKTIKGFKEIFINESPENKGLADSIIKGVTSVVNQYDKIIVLEDDIVVSPFFLEYMNKGLEVYENVSNVYSINGYMFNIDSDKTEAVLSPLATSSWGWATWKDKWMVYDSSLRYKSLIQQNKSLATRFNFSEYDYAKMLDVNSSWAIKWYYSVFLRHGLGLFPTKTLVKNIGADGSGTHETLSQTKNDKLSDLPISVKLKEEIDVDVLIKMLEYFNHHKISYYDKIINALKKLKLNWR